MTLGSKIFKVVVRAVKEVVLGTVRDLLTTILPIFLQIKANNQRQILDITILASKIDVLCDAEQMIYPLQHGVANSGKPQSKGFLTSACQ